MIPADGRVMGYAGQAMKIQACGRVMVYARPSKMMLANG